MTNRDDRSELGTRLREAREYRGFSQEEVASHLGISRSAVSLLETGNRRLEALELRKLARLYQCKMEELTGDNPLPSPPESVRMVARAAAELSPEDRDEVLRFAEFLRSRTARGKDD